MVLYVNSQASASRSGCDPPPPAGLHLCAGGSGGNSYVGNRNPTEITVQAYVSQHRGAPLCA